MVVRGLPARPPVLGRALAAELAGRGWQVAISARRESDLQNVAAQHANIHGFVCDVTDRAAMAQTVRY